MSAWDNAMPKQITVTNDDLNYLRQAVSEGKTSYPEMAKRIGVCTDTCKRILHKNNIVEFTGAKYTVSRASVTETWTRPCICCKSQETRPKNQYMCSSCRKQRGFENE